MIELLIHCFNKFFLLTIYIVEKHYYNSLEHLQAHTVKHCPYNPEQLKKQTELAEIWKQYRCTTTLHSRPSPPRSPTMTMSISSANNFSPLSSSSHYNSRLGVSPSLHNTSSSTSSSPLMSPNSSGYFSHPSSPSSSISSPQRQHSHHGLFQQQPQTMRQPQRELFQPNENFYENLLNLLQISN